MKLRLSKIVHTYGIKAQLKHFHSEVYELIEAILKYESLKDWELRKDITEEIADVYVMLEQFAIYYELDHEQMANNMRDKIDRQIIRIAKGE